MERNERFLVIAGTLCGLYHPNIEKIWPQSKLVKLLPILSLFPMVLVPSYTVFGLKYILFENANIVLKTFASAPAAYTGFSAYLGWSFYFNKNKFVKISDLWRSSFQDDLFKESRQALLDQEIKISMKAIKLVMSISILSAAGYGTTTYFSPGKKFTHPVGFSYRSQSPDFELLTTYELVILLFVFSTLATYESMTMYLLTLEKAQLMHLKKSLARIFEYISVTESGEMKVDERIEHAEAGTGAGPKKPCVNDAVQIVEKNLRIWIRQHQETLRFHEELQKLYYYPLSFKYIAFVIFIIMAVCLNIMNTGFTFKERLLTGCFLINNYSLFYLNLRNADIIGETDRTIFGEAFGSSWYFDRKSLSPLINIIILKSHKPVELVALKICRLSSKTFFKIFSLAYSFLTCFLQISKTIDM